MKQLIAIILALAFLTLPLSRASWPAVLAGSPPAAAATYLIEQNFEGTGYDNGETWTESGTIDEDYTTAPAPLTGSQSLHLGSSWAVATSPTFTGQTEVWAFCRLQPDDYWSANGAYNRMFSINAADDTELVGFRVAYVGETPNAGVKLYAGGSESAASSVVLDRGATYNVWLHYVSGGTCELFVSQSTTRPSADGSGDVYLSRAGATNSATKVNVQCISGDYLVADRVLVSASEIGNNP